MSRRDSDFTELARATEAIFSHLKKRIINHSRLRKAFDCASHTKKTVLAGNEAKFPYEIVLLIS